MLVSTSVFFMTVSPAVADPLSPPTAAQIVMKIDKNRYNPGDVLVISGQVQSVVSDMQLTIQILDPNNNLVHIDQIPVTSDGKFSLPVKIYGPLWSMPGKYSIIAQYGFKHISAIVNFQFEQVSVPIQNAFNVKDPSSGQNFDLNYTITGGQVENMALDKQNIALVVQINSTDSGMLHLQIPRLLLDSKKPSNADESFLVFINGDEITSFQQTGSDYNYRILDIPIVTGDSKIEIIGTNVIPEFENISNLILVMAVGLTTIFSVLLQTRMNTKLLNL